MKPHIALIASLTLILLAGALAAAPPPLTPPFAITKPYVPVDQWDQRFVDDAGAVALANGDFAVAWYNEQDSSGVKVANWMMGRRIRFDGKPGEEFGVFSAGYDPYGEAAVCPALAATGSDRFVVSYVRLLQVGSVLQANIENSESDPSGIDILVSDSPDTADLEVSCPTIGASPDGRFAIAWSQAFIIDDRPGSWTYKVRAPSVPTVSLSAPPSLSTHRGPMRRTRTSRRRSAWTAPVASSRSGAASHLRASWRGASRRTGLPWALRS